MPRRPPPSHSSAHAINQAGMITEPWKSIGPPDFSSSSTMPVGLDPTMNHLAREAIRATSTVGLDRIALCMQTNASLGEYPQLFRIFFYHLKLPPPVHCTTELTEADLLKARVGAASLHGIFTVHELLQSRLELEPGRDTCNSLLIRTLTDSWPDIWKWIKYLHWVNPSLVLLLTHPNTISRWRGIIIRIIGHFVYGAKTTFGDIIAATPEVFTMLVDLWAKIAEVEVVEEESEMDSSLVTMAILHLLETNSSLSQKFVELIGGGMDRIATLMLKNLRQAFNIKEEEALVALFQQILAFSAVIANFLPGLHHALLSQNSMVIVTRTFGRISSMRAQEQLDQLAANPFTNRASYSIHQGTSTCVLYIKEASSTSGGFTWVIQAVRSGMIPALIRSACRDRGEIDHQLVIDCLIEGLQPYLVYRSVLRAVSKAFQDPIIKTLESALSRDGEFYKVWVKFRELVNLRLALKNLFDASGEYAQGCSTVNCENVGENEHFKLCSNCLEASYCSEACQKRDWKNGGHRAACASLRKARADGVSPQISTRDTLFLLFLATQIVSSNRSEILRTRDELIASDPAHRDSFIINVDPSSHPSHFSISTPRDQPKYRMYVPIRYHTHRPPTIKLPRDLPRSLLSAMVDIYMVIPYGAEKVILPSRTWQILCLYGDHAYNWKDLADGHLISL